MKTLFEIATARDEIRAVASELAADATDQDGKAAWLIADAACDALSWVLGENPRSTLAEELDTLVERVRRLQSG